jgi:hypothetical protein
MTIHQRNNTRAQQHNKTTIYNITTIRQYINTTIHKDNNTTKQQYNITTILLLKHIGIFSHHNLKLLLRITIPL